MNGTLRSSLIAGAIAIVAYTVISLAFGGELGSTLVVALLLGLFTVAVSFAITYAIKAVVRSRNQPD